MTISIDEAWLRQLHGTLSKFAQIPEYEWNKLLTKLHFLKLKKNEFLIKVEEGPDKMAFIISGIFRVFYNTESGIERILAIRDENCLLSSYSSFLENTQSRFSFQALEDSCLFYISLKSYNELVTSHICWQTISGKYAELLYLEKEKREIEFLTEDAETRYNNFIDKYPTFENRISQYYIASYLGITPVTLSRIRRKI